MWESRLLSSRLNGTTMPLLRVEDSMNGLRAAMEDVLRRIRIWSGDARDR